MKMKHAMLLAGEAIGHLEAFQPLGRRMALYDSGGGGSQNTTSTTKVEYSPEEQAARNKVMQAALDTYDNSVAKANGAGYPGAKPVGPSSTTQAAWGAAGNTAMNINQQAADATKANNFGLHDALYAESNPYLQSAMTAATAPMIREFTQAGGPMATIRQNAVDNNTYGGSRQGIAEGLAMQGLQDKVGSMRAAMSSDAYYKGLEQMNNSVNNSSKLAMMQMLVPQLLGQVGAQQEGFAQAGENYNAAARDYALNGQWQPLQNLANVIYGGSNGTTTTTGQTPTPDTTMQTVGTLGSLGLMAMMAFSDRRLKRNITKIGMHKGLGVYAYGIGDRWEIGVIAQEVQKVLPAAVHRHPSGYLMVDYGMI